MCWCVRRAAAQTTTPDHFEQEPASLMRLLWTLKIAAVCPILSSL
jgi:hypothetical protein